MLLLYINPSLLIAYSLFLCLSMCLSLSLTPDWRLIYSILRASGLSHFIAINPFIVFNFISQKTKNSRKQKHNSGDLYAGRIVVTLTPYTEGNAGRRCWERERERGWLAGGYGDIHCGPWEFRGVVGGGSNRVIKMYWVQQRRSSRTNIHSSRTNCLLQDKRNVQQTETAKTRNIKTVLRASRMGTTQGAVR